MIGYYALPADDALATYLPVMTASAGDTAYSTDNWHQVIPSKPAKLTTTSGNWVFDFLSAKTIVAFGIVYHNFVGVTVTLQWNSSDSWGTPAGQQVLSLSAATEDGWTVNDWAFLTDVPNYRYFRLLITGTNANPLALGRPVFLTNLRDLGNDVRWGVEETEDHGVVEMATELGVETIYDLGGKRRAFSGELALMDSTASSFITLVRSALGRQKPFYIVPQQAVSDLWCVRVEESKWSRTREMIEHNIFPFRVRELSRGLPWP